jgi:hypothetical protein
VDTNRRLAITELRSPPDNSARISASRFVRPCGLLRVDIREPRGTPRAALGAHVFAQRLRRRSGAELFEDRECLTLLGFCSVHREHGGMFIGTAQILPGARRTTPVTQDFHRVGFCHVRWMLLKSTYSPQPRCKLASHSWITALAYLLIRGLHFSHDTLPIACEPRSLGADCGKRSDPLQLWRRTAECPCLFQRRVCLGVAAPNSQVPENPTRTETRGQTPAPHCTAASKSPTNASFMGSWTARARAMTMYRHS